MSRGVAEVTAITSTAWGLLSGALLVGLGVLIALVVVVGVFVVYHFVTRSSRTDKAMELLPTSLNVDRSKVKKPLEVMSNA